MKRKDIARKAKSSSVSKCLPFTLGRILWMKKNKFYSLLSACQPPSGPPANSIEFVFVRQKRLGRRNASGY